MGSTGHDRHVYFDRQALRNWLRAMLYGVRDGESVNAEARFADGHDFVQGRRTNSRPALT